MVNKKKKSILMALLIYPYHDEVLTALEALHVHSRAQIVRDAILEKGRRDLTEPSDDE